MDINKALGMLILIGVLTMVIMWLKRDGIKDIICEDDIITKFLVLLITWAILTFVPFGLIMLVWLGVHLLLA